jgi:glycerophosphoryl diester phosphodiesterase
MKKFDWLTKSPLAHRGLHDDNEQVFENSLTSFQLAIDNGYGIECDLHIDRNGVPIVFHDDALNRVTNFKGDVREFTTGELAKIKLSGTNDHIPSLQEMFDLVKGQVPILLELKGRRGKDEGFVKAVVDMVNAYDGNAVMMSFDHWLIEDMDKYCGDIPFGLTAEGTDHRYDVHMNLYKKHPFDFMSYYVGDLPCKIAQELREEKNMPILTWAPRTKEEQAISEQYADQMTFEMMDPR